MKQLKGHFGIFFLLICTSFFELHTPIKSAERISFINGAFQRTIPIKDIENYISTGKAEGILKDIFPNNTDNPEQATSLLTQEFELPIELTSNLMNSRIGEVIIKRVGKIIYPLRVQKDSVSVPAIRSAVINGLVKGKGKINLLLFLKSYPNKIVAINGPALMRVVKKVESISELVEFFSGSPLDRLKEGAPNA